MKCIVRNISVSMPQSSFSLRGVSFSLSEGEILAIVGESGAGKTTLLNVLAGFLPIQHGVIVLDNVTVSCATFSLPPVQRNVGYIFQHHNLLPHRTIMQNVTLGMSDIECDERADEIALVLQELDIYALRGAYPPDVSGGQQQRAALARALLHNKKLLLFDEPFTGLDAPRMRQLAATIRASIKKHGRIGLIVTHHTEEAFLLADKIAIMKGGVLSPARPLAQMYHAPDSVETARALGPAYPLEGVIKRPGVAATDFGEVHIASRDTVLSDSDRACPGMNPEAGARVVLHTRPDDYELELDSSARYAVVSVVFSGMHQLITVSDGTRLVDVLADHHEVYREGDRVRVRVRSDHPYVPLPAETMSY